MQAPQLGREVPADQHVAGAHVPVEQTFAVEELLIVDRETGVGIKHLRTNGGEMSNYWENMEGVLVAGGRCQDTSRVLPRCP